MMEVAGDHARVELGEGVLGICNMAAKAAAQEQAADKSAPGEARADLSSLSSMLTARWKGGAASGSSAAKKEAAQAGQIRSFRIAKLDAKAKKIELELA